FIDADTINRLGIHYPILVIPPTERIPFDTVNKISLFAATDGKVIVIGHSPSLTSDGKPINPIVFRSFSTLVADEAHLAEALHSAVSPDLKLDSTDPAVLSDIGFIHRKLPDADIYFVVNTSNQPLHTTAAFATRNRGGRALNPETGEAEFDMVFPEKVELDLAPYESRAFYFYMNGVTGIFDIAHGPTQNLSDLSTDWSVTFTSTNKTETQTTLTDWATNPETKFYSGEAVYSRDFNLASVSNTPVFLEIEGGTAISAQPLAQPEPAVGIPNPLVTRTGPGMRAWYDPPVREAAIVYINGQRAGSLWHPPYRLDVTHLLKPGQNHIEIRVYNTAINAWAALPPHDYKPLIEKFGDRFQMQDLDKVKPIPSGILGQIHLVTETK
ncbi:MAG TPA: glycosyl hydrolase, partial [Edaphobacter sp.]